LAIQSNNILAIVDDDPDLPDFKKLYMNC